MPSQDKNIDLRLIRYAVTLASELHFGRAAARLSITQQTLSAQIAQLERRLGMPLFIRDRRHVEITEVGRIFIDKGRILLADAQELLSVLEQTTSPLRLDVVAEGLPPDVLAHHLRERLPGVDLEVLHGHGLAATMSLLGEGRVDLAFGRIHGPHAALPRMFSHELVRLAPMGIALPPGHALVTRDDIPLTELADHPVLLYTAPEAVGWEEWNEQLVADFGLSFARKVRGHGRGAAGAAVRAYGMPSFASLDAPRLENTAVRAVVEPVPVYPWSAVWRSDRMNDTLALALATIRDIVAELRWLEPPDGTWWMPLTDRSGIPDL